MKYIGGKNILNSETLKLGNNTIKKKFAINKMIPQQYSKILAIFLEFRNHHVIAFWGIGFVCNRLVNCN